MMKKQSKIDMYNVLKKEPMKTSRKITASLLKRLGYQDVRTVSEAGEDGYRYSYRPGIRLYYKKNTNQVIIRTALSDGVLLYKGPLNDIQLLTSDDFFKCLIEARRIGMNYERTR